MTNERTVAIPAGTTCTCALKRCIFAVYSGRMRACNCRLYHCLLKGGGNPVKCPQCIAESQKTTPEAEV